MTPFMHGTHDLGMAFDLGVSSLIKESPSQALSETLTLDAESLANTLFNSTDPLDKTTRYDHIPDWNPYDQKKWSYANAVYLSNFLSDDPLNNQKAALQEFLSLYAMTQSDTITGNGTLDDLPVKNGNAVRAALFGNGSMLNFISQVHIGGERYTDSKGVIHKQNPYLNINEILNRLGITATPVQDHQNHFHIFLNPPAVQGIGVNHLLADAPLISPTDSVLPAVTLQTGAQGLLDYAQTNIEGEELMFTMDVPYVPVQNTPVVLAQNATPVTATHPDYLLKTCEEKPSAGGSITAMNMVAPADSLVGELVNRSGRSITNDAFMAMVAAVKLTQLQGATHGKLIPQPPASGRVYYEYRSDPGYEGDDRTVFMAEFEGKRYKIVIDLIVSMVIDENSPQCPQPKLIKVTKPSAGSSDYGSGYSLASIKVNFGDLSGGAVGQESGSNITLDANAAGNNWFIDTTPADNSEFLPTSNPNEWVAKAGSAAYGKMDMLSVLLHEYGHALGIEHSADTGDYMGTTLTPGVRRLPSATELALMQQLIGEAKNGLAIAPSLTLPQGERGPGDAPAPFPTLPIGTSLSLAFLGRVRSNRFGGMNIDLVSAITPAPVPRPQYEVSANATFTSLNTASGWNTQGSVDIVSSTGTAQTGTATLNEVSTSQTRLSQVFMLGDRDRAADCFT
jgi:hypothetical protein